MRVDLTRSGRQYVLGLMRRRLKRTIYLARNHDNPIVDDYR